VLIVLVALLPRSWRRRRAARRDRKAEAGDSDESAYEPATEAVSRWSPDDDADLASSTLSEDQRPIRRTVRLPSQPSSEWMPPSRKSLVDELLEDETETPDAFSGLADFGRDVHEERGRDVHEDLDGVVREEPGGDVHEDFDRDVHEEFDEDPDNVDTDPTGIPLLDDGRSGRHAASSAHDDDAEVTEAVPIPRIAAGQLAIHLPMDDPYQVPDGYPVKGNASFGLYYMPDSALYEDTMAEIWFASEEIAQANGFHKAG
jgi:hypothetical protein